MERLIGVSGMRGKNYFAALIWDDRGVKQVVVTDQDDVREYDYYVYNPPNYDAFRDWLYGWDPDVEFLPEPVPVQKPYSYKELRKILRRGGIRV